MSRHFVGAPAGLIYNIQVTLPGLTHYNLHHDHKLMSGPASKSLQGVQRLGKLGRPDFLITSKEPLCEYIQNMNLQLQLQVAWIPKFALTLELWRALVWTSPY